MIDIDSHQVVDMIPSREYEDVKVWLRKYPNITIVSRDGSITYHNAIDDALPDAFQVSDRFHLLKNLTSYAQEYLKKELGVHIKISGAGALGDPKPESEANGQQDAVSVNGEFENRGSISKADENRKLTLKEKYERIFGLISLGYSKTAICKSLNMDIRGYAKLINAPPDELETMFKTSNELTHEEKLKQKTQRIDEVRKLKGQGLSLRGISRCTGLDCRTVRKYLDDKYVPAHATYGKKKPGILTPFMTEIDNMLSQGIMGTVIETKIREKGYAGSPSNLRHYITEWKRRRKQNIDYGSETSGVTEIVERKDLFKLLYHPLEKVKLVTKAQLSAINAQYPCFEKVRALVWSFKSLFQSQDSNALDLWLKMAKSLNIREINSFTEGVARDLTAVKNAIALPYSNGLAEGSVNKLKVIKRIMYGRCKFETLRTKVLRLEEFKHFN